MSPTSLDHEGWKSSATKSFNTAILTANHPVKLTVYFVSIRHPSWNCYWVREDLAENNNIAAVLISFPNRVGELSDWASSRLCHRGRRRLADFWIMMGPWDAAPVLLSSREGKRRETQTWTRRWLGFNCNIRVMMCYFDEIFEAFFLPPQARDVLSVLTYSHNIPLKGERIAVEVTETSPRRSWNYHNHWTSTVQCSRE